jgi:hypothetical protein
MNASELMEELKTRLPDVPILVHEGDIIARITSVLKNKPHEPILLFGEPMGMGQASHILSEAMAQDVMGQASHILSEAMAQGVMKAFYAKITESALNPGKFELSIAGYSEGAGEFDTRNEAVSYMRGFTFGFTTGSGIKNIADGLPSRLT